MNIIVNSGFPHHAVLASAQYDLSWGVIAGGGSPPAWAQVFNWVRPRPAGGIGSYPLTHGSRLRLTSGFWFVRYTTLSGIVHLQQFGATRRWCRWSCRCACRAVSSPCRFTP